MLQLSGLTKQNTAQNERVQKAVFAIILDKQYESYESACTTLQMSKLSDRREELSHSFALKASKHPIHKDWFVPDSKQTATRQNQLSFKPPQARTNRFMQSAIPYLTNLLNE